MEAFDDGAAEAHVNSDHFQTARRDLRPPLARTPDIVSTTIEGADGWSETGELALD